MATCTGCCWSSEWPRLIAVTSHCRRQAGRRSTIRGRVAPGKRLQGSAGRRSEEVIPSNYDERGGGTGHNDTEKLYIPKGQRARTGAENVGEAQSTATRADSRDRFHDRSY